MKVELKKIEKSQVVLHIEVSVEEMNPHLQKAAARIAEELKFPGFRPGKAPYDIVKQRIGEMGILQEAADSIVGKTVFEAIKENKLVTIGQPKIEIDKLAPGNPMIYKATVAILPKVTVGDLKTINLTRGKIEVKKEKIDDIVNNIAKMRAKETKVERAAIKGDKLDINFDITLDKVLIEHGQYKNYAIVLGEGRFIPGFEDNLIGIKAGETKVFSLTFPENYHAKNLAGKKCEFTTVCNLVNELILPEINDEFAKTISGGKFADVEAMRKAVEENIHQEEEFAGEQKLELEMLTKLAEISTIEELPEVLIDGEVHKMIHELEHQVTENGLKFDEYLTSIKRTSEQLEKEVRPEAEKRVKIAIITREIFQEQKIDVTEEEIKKQIDELVAHYGNNPEARQQMESPAYRDYIINRIGNKKVIEYLKAQTIK